MNLKRSILIAGTMAVLLWPAGVHAQTGSGYDLSWHIVTGGATNAAGGSYTLNAIAGQLGASQSINGNLLLLGGFWHWPSYDVSLPICIRGK